jgi:hypothetical protein
MATTTPNYGWTVPTSTDLVEDGATAIETLGDAIDASMNTALGTKKAGMVLLNTTSFSAVASQSVNDVFSATYDNYRVVISVKGSTNLFVEMRYRVSGADNTTSSYNFAWTVLDESNASNNQFQSGSTIMRLPTITTTEYYGGTDLTILDPFKTERTRAVGTGYGLRSNYTAAASYAGGTLFDANTSFTGFSLIASTGNMTGSVSTYGYNK